MGEGAPRHYKTYGSIDFGYPNTKTLCQVKEAKITDLVFINIFRLIRSSWILEILGRCPAPEKQLINLQWPDEGGKVGGV